MMHGAVASSVALQLRGGDEVGMGGPADSYVLIRVKLRGSVVDALKEAAEEETERSGRYVYVSNLIREALREWLRARGTRISE